MHVNYNEWRNENAFTITITEKVEKDAILLCTVRMNLRVKKHAIALPSSF